MNEHDPPPFGDAGSGAPEVLRDAIAEAREQTPSARQIASLGARLPLGVPSPGGGGGGGGGVPGAAPPSVLSGALIGAALGVAVSGAGLYWEAKREASTTVSAPSQVVAPPRASGEAPRAEPSTLPATAATSAASATPRALPVAVSPPASAAASAAEPEAATAPGSAGAAAPAIETESEVHLLQRAQDALGSSPAQALALTEQHAARFPAGALGQEREVLAIQALLRLGRADEARARGQRFIAAFPGSVHRRRIEALIGP